MKKKLSLVITCLVVFTISVNAQQLYVPREIKKAYANGTRSVDGKSGKKYWQNRAKYAININVTPPARQVTGTEVIDYTNNSPDTLKTLAIKLLLNNHMAGAIRLRQAREEYFTDGISIDSFSVNGTVKTWRKAPVPLTTQRVRLQTPVAPNETVHLSFSWHYDLSKESNREGVIDSTSFFVAYFYPRVAVYDDCFGWDFIDFTDSQEFYSDFNDYTLNVTVPKNFIVWSTGTLQNTADVLQPEYAKRLSKSFTSDEVINVASKNDLLDGKVTQNKTNTWQWSAVNVPDMAVGISDHFVWDASSVVVDKNTKRRSAVQAAYNDTAADYHKMVEYGKHSLDWFSNNWPGIAYPYPKTTIFQGFADMEYPMMVNDNTSQDPNFTRFVAEHEIAHSWFPFYMGINESRYAFMDEGWATALELLIGRADQGDSIADSLFKRFRVEQWIKDNSTEEDLPVITPADALKGIAYGNNAYGKPALAYIALKDMLGDDLFRKCLHTYMERWNGKHPIPWDFFYTFNDASGKDLNWFWNSWFFGNGYIDLAVGDVKKTGTGLAVTVQNKGGFVAPVNVLLTYTDGSTETKHLTSEIWKANLSEAVVNIKTTKKIKSIKLDGGIFMDANEKNNIWEKKQ
jgi:hypothetical protein